jgi:glyoxylase-like metal-dependent hydrolase (beta-lactamase superfamily II)
MDINRTYLMGYSEGAAGVWQLLASYPRMFAAGVAAAGYGDPYRVRSAREVPIWAFHAIDDDIIPSTGATGAITENENVMVGSGWLVQALRNVGTASNLKYTELSGGHQIMEQVLTGDLMDWLCVQNRKKVFRVDRICPGVWKIDDYFMSSCYLVEGKEKALLIDTGLGEGDFGELVRQLTDRPISLAITHPHVDHMYHSCLFEEIYIHDKAAQKFKELYEEMRQMDVSVFDSLSGVSCPPLGEGIVRGLSDGEVISLDDTCKITAVYLPGHTEYDCVFLDDTHKCVFTGDAVGSGYTVGVPMAEDELEEVLGAYRDQLGRFLEKYRKQVKDYSFLGGHFIQENSCDDTMQEDYLNGRSKFFVPLSLQVFEDMKVLCDRIIEGKCQNEKKGGEYSWVYRSARIGGTFK